MGKIFGVRNMSVEMGANDLTSIHLELLAEPGEIPSGLNDLYSFNQWDEYFPDKQIVKCQYCSQWGVRKMSCKHCGGAIE